MPLTLALDAIDAGHFRPVTVPGDGLPSAREGWMDDDAEPPTSSVLQFRRVKQ